MKTKIWYSVQDYGDGSVYPEFFTTKELAELDQEIEVERGYGWGEQCIGYLEIISDTPIIISGISSKESKIQEFNDMKKEGYITNIEVLYLKKLEEIK